MALTQLRRMPVRYEAKRHQDFGAIRRDGQPVHKVSNDILDFQFTALVDNPRKG